MTPDLAPPPAAPDRPVVLVSWDGKSLPLAYVQLDAVPDFDWLLFDYTGSQPAGLRELRGQRVRLLSAATECKGEIFHHLAEHLAERQAERQDSGGGLPEFVALIDDDILLSVSQINQALHLGRCLELDVFAPTLSRDSAYSYDWTLSQPQTICREVDFVEVMMPFYRGEVFLAGRAQYRGNVSSWGVDWYLIPTVQQLTGRTRTAVLDVVMASHRRPVTSGGKIYRNGLNAMQEAMAMKQACLDRLRAEAPQLLQTEWHQRIFERRLGPTPWVQFKRRVRRKLRKWAGALKKR